MILFIFDHIYLWNHYISKEIVYIGKFSFLKEVIIF